MWDSKTAVWFIISTTNLAPITTVINGSLSASVICKGTYDSDMTLLRNANIALAHLAGPLHTQTIRHVPPHTDRYIWNWWRGLRGSPISQVPVSILHWVVLFCFYLWCTIFYKYLNPERLTTVTYGVEYFFWWHAFIPGSVCSKGLWVSHQVLITGWPHVTTNSLVCEESLDYGGDNSWLPFQ